MNIITIDNVCKNYKSKKALDNVSIQFPEKGMVFLLGKSGSGKSTMLRLLMRFWEIDEGQLAISSHDINTIDSESLLKMQSFMEKQRLAS